MSTSLRILIDDTPIEGLKSEHGLSIYIESNGVRILFDTGQSPGFAGNAELLDIDLSGVDFAVISHGHYDHGNGLPAFFSRNTDAPVYIHPAATETVYFSRDGESGERYVGIAPEAVNAGRRRFTGVSETLRPAERVLLIPCSELANRSPIKNDNTLFIRKNETEVREAFDHEIFMVIEEDDEYIIISGCSHNNILSIIDYCVNLYGGQSPRAVIGGFHMPGEPASDPSYLEAVRKAAAELAAVTENNAAGQTALKDIQHPLYITGHCTGKSAGLMLKSKLGDNIDFFHTGSLILL